MFSSSSFNGIESLQQKTDNYSSELIFLLQRLINQTAFITNDHSAQLLMSDVLRFPLRVDYKGRLVQRHSDLLASTAFRNKRFHGH